MKANTEARFHALLDKYLTDSINAEEKSELAGLLETAPFNGLLQQVINDRLQDRSLTGEEDVTLREKSFATLSRLLDADVQVAPAVHRVHFLRRSFFRYAAAIIVLAGLASYFWFSHKKSAQPVVTVENKPAPAHDIMPGSNKAVLTLADGRSIALDSAVNGQLAVQQGANIIKKDGGIFYDAQAQAGSTVVYNTMSTPRGGQYQLTLPDGTKVWLNAESSVTYPVAFVGDHRKVKVTGEAYFEVTKNKEKPFIVDVDGRSSVEVLGTHFNVNSYADESSIKTTLLEGSVKVVKDKQQAIIRPGQQAQVSTAITVVNDADLDLVMAWKNGLFVLQDANLQEVMRQLTRWYDIQIHYEGTIPAVQFQGKMDRGVRLSSVIKWFSDLGIHCHLDGRTLIVTGS